MTRDLTRASEEGTPQGGSLSSLLSNVYLHYVLDLWFEKKFRAKLAECKEWLKKERSRRKAGAILQTAKRKLEGHLQYYAITDNAPKCSAFRYQTVRLLFKWLNRRSQRRSYTWEQFNQALAWVGMPRVRVLHDLNPCRVGPE